MTKRRQGVNHRELRWKDGQDGNCSTARAGTCAPPPRGPLDLSEGVGPLTPSPPPARSARHRRLSLPAAFFHPDGDRAAQWPMPWRKKLRAKTDAYALRGEARPPHGQPAHPVSPPSRRKNWAPSRIAYALRSGLRPPGGVTPQGAARRAVPHRACRSVQNSNLFQARVSYTGTLVRGSSIAVSAYRSCLCNLIPAAPSS